jgi:hypothetical protein
VQDNSKWEKGREMVYWTGLLQVKTGWVKSPILGIGRGPSKSILVMSKAER